MHEKTGRLAETVGRVGLKLNARKCKTSVRLSLLIVGGYLGAIADKEGEGSKNIMNQVQKA